LNTHANINPTTIVRNAMMAEKPENVRPMIKTIGIIKPIVVLNPQLSLEAIIKYKIIAIIVAKNTLPTSSETKIHLKSNISQLAI